MNAILTRGFRKIRRVAVRTAAKCRKPSRAAIIGCGQIAPDHIAGYESTSLGVVIALSDVRGNALGAALRGRRAVVTFRDPARMFQQSPIDVVSICTWPGSHASLVDLAAAGGVKGILCEKPLALSMFEMRRMIDSCERACVKLAGGHQYRFHPSFVAALAAIGRGTIGEVLRASGQIAGSLANNGPHLFDTVRFLLRDRRALEVVCNCVMGSAIADHGYPSEDAASGQIRFDGHVDFEFRTGSGADKFFEIVVEGTRGTIIARPGSLFVNGSAYRLPQDAMAVCRRRQFSEFLQWVRGRKTSYVANGIESMKSSELVLAAYESARGQRSVELPLSNDGDVIRQFFSGDTHATAASGSEKTEDSSTRELPYNRNLAIDGGQRAVKHWFSDSPAIGAAELMATARVIRSKRLNCVDGSTVAALERSYADTHGAVRAVASTSGTAALHVAVASLDLEPCDEVITTPMSDMGSVIPILCCNCVPVFADIDPLSGNLTAETIAERITPRTRAVILVHLFGRPADVGPISELCRARGLALIEDCSQAHFAEYRGKKVGTFGDLGCFSFQQSKQITCGDGGITLVNRSDLAERAALFVDKGWNRSKGLRSHEFLGLNYRMTELQGAVALAQFRKLPRLVASRRDSANFLVCALERIPGVVLPGSEDINSAWWKFNFAVEAEAAGIDPDGFADALCAEGVRVVRQYIPRPLFEEEMFSQRRTFGKSGYPLSASTCPTPDRADFPGLAEFYQKQCLIHWSHHAKRQHASQIASAFLKISKTISERKCAKNAMLLPA